MISTRRYGWAAALVAGVALVSGCGKSPPDLPFADDPVTTVRETTTTMGRLPADEDDSSTTPIANPAVPPAPPASKSPSCRQSDPLANVHDPARFQVVVPCITMSGRARLVHTDPDGDIHIDLQPDDPFLGLLNDKNRTERRGYLMVKIVPADQPGCAHGQAIRPGQLDYGFCTGADILMPGSNSHLSVTGPYVLNRIRGWMEIHPAWAVNQQTVVPTTASPTIPPIYYPTGSPYDGTPGSGSGPSPTSYPRPSPSTTYPGFYSGYPTHPPTPSTTATTR